MADQDLVEACRAAMCGESLLYPGAMSVLVRNYENGCGGGTPCPRTY